MKSEKRRNVLKYLVFSLLSAVAITFSSIVFTWLNTKVPPGTGSEHMVLVMILFVLIWCVLGSLVSFVISLFLSGKNFVESFFC